MALSNVLLSIPVAFLNHFLSHDLLNQVPAFAIILKYIVAGKIYIFVVFVHKKYFRRKRLRLSTEKEF